MLKNKSDLESRINVPVYWSNPIKNSHDSEIAKAIRKGIPLDMQVYIAHKEIEADEINNVINQSGKLDHWLVKSKNQPQKHRLSMTQLLKLDMGMHFTLDLN
jgi:hypothetical protein